MNRLDIQPVRAGLLRSGVHSAVACAAIVPVLFASGCGGGGGDAGAGNTGGGTGPSTSGAFKSPFVGVRLSSDFTIPETVSPNAAVGQVEGSAGLMLDLGQFAVDIAHRLATAGGPKSVDTTCPAGGSFSLSLDDKDGNGIASAGDTLNATLRDCPIPVLRRTVSGSFQLQIDAEPKTPVNRSLQGRIILASGLTLSGFVGDEIPGGTVTGSLSVQWSETDTLSSLRVLSAPEDNLNFVSSSATMAWRRIDIDRVARLDEATVTSKLAFAYERSGLQANVTTITPWIADLNRYPSHGVVQLQGNGRKVRMAATEIGGTASLGTEVLTDAGQSLETRTAFRNSGPAGLGWDGRRQIVGLGGSAGPIISAPRIEMPSDLSFNISSVYFATGPGLEVLTDRLFLRPVLPDMGSTSQGAAFRWQVGAALADAPPTLQFRFLDTYARSGSGTPGEGIAATVVRNGSAYFLRPVESLRHGKPYLVQASTNGADWRPAAPMQLQLRGGGSVPAEGDIGGFFTPRALMSTIEFGTTSLVGADDLCTVTGAVTLFRGQSAPQLRWRQESGEPLILETPDAATTKVRYAAGPPRPVSTAVLVFSAEDSVGNIDRERVSLIFGDVSPVGAAMYLSTAISLQPGRLAQGVVSGPGSVTSYASVPGAWSVSASAFGGQGTFAAPNGGPLVVAVYENPVIGGVPQAGRAWMACMVSPCASGTTGRIDVREVAYANDGQVIRLAVDFEQRDSAEVFETVRRSFRYNSSVALRR